MFPYLLIFCTFCIPFIPIAYIEDIEAVSLYIHDKAIHKSRIDPEQKNML